MEYKLDLDGWVEPEQLVIEKAGKVGEEGLWTQVCRIKEKALHREHGGGGGGVVGVEEHCEAKKEKEQKGSVTHPAPKSVLGCRL